MSEQLPSEQKLEHRGYAVVDANGIDVRMKDMRDAQRCRKQWDRDDPKAGPHRIMEVLYREVKP